MHLTPDPMSRDVEARSHRALQRELVETRNRFDRQVSQLKRLNDVAASLQHRENERPLVEAFSEAIIDVLDVGLGVVWVIDEQLSHVEPRFGVTGEWRNTHAWADAGPAVDRMLAESGNDQAQRIDASLIDLLPGVDLFDVMACRCIGRDGGSLAVLLAAHTPITVGADDAPGDDALEVLTLLAEKCADHLDASSDWQVIEQQVQQLRESEERLELVLRGTNDGWWDWDLARGTCVLSARWSSMLQQGEPETRVIDRFWDDLIHDADHRGFMALLEQALVSGRDSIESELRLRRDDDTFLPVLVRGTIMRDATGLPIRFAGSITDLSERKRQEDRIHRLAFYDALTELPNRRLLMDRLHQSLLASTRLGTTTATLMIDLDRFKSLNDTHGHSAGDELLRAVARRLKDTVRGHDTVARLGGDEFVVLLENLGNDGSEPATTAAAIAQKVLTALSQPYDLSVGVTHHSASVGVALSSDPDCTPAAILKHADVAMYEAKGAGRNTVRLFHPEMQQRVNQRTDLETRLRVAFDLGQLTIMYQPQVDRAGRLYGAEALMRWHPDNGEPIPPSLFIPVAEESGLIDSIGQWALEVTCQQISRWHSVMPEGFRVAVNVSATEFMNAAFPARVVEILERTGVSGRHLRLEITEANVVTELRVAAERMSMLRAHEVEFSLDDFGTGYSSLTYLRQLPVTEVKIDRSYVRRFLVNQQDEAIMRAILALCDSLDIRVVAEGVETIEQWHRLMGDGCPYFQGYLFGRAVPASADPQDLLAESLTQAL